MKIRTFLASFALFLFTFNAIQAQSSSIQLSGNAAFYERVSGEKLSLKLSTPIKGKLQFFGEADLIRLNDKFETSESFIGFDGVETRITYSNQTQFFILSAGLEYPAVSIGKIDFNLNLSGGFLRDSVDYFGVIKGGISLDTKISNRISVGVPLSYSFITWRKDWIASLGLKFSYLY